MGVEFLARGFFHEANEPLAVELRVHAAELALDPAYPLVPRLGVLQVGVHLCSTCVHAKKKREGAWAVKIGKRSRVRTCRVDGFAGQLSTSKTCA